MQGSALVSPKGSPKALFQELSCRAVGVGDDLLRGAGGDYLTAAIEPPDLLIWINLFAFGTLEATFLYPMVLGLYWDKGNATGAIASIVCGVAVFVALTILKLDMGGIHAIVPTALVAVISFVAGSYAGALTGWGKVRA